jgi:hypothetical protein
MMRRDMKRLYAIYLGGKAPRANIEVHDVVFLTSANILENTDLIKQKWFGDKTSVHIDAIGEISKVEGYEIGFESLVKSENRLYFINFGAKANGKLAEQHDSGFFVGKNKSEAIQKAKAQLLVGLDDIHLDNMYDIDDCLDVSDLTGIVLSKSDDEETIITIQNLYKKI